MATQLSFLMRIGIMTYTSRFNPSALTAVRPAITSSLEQVERELTPYFAAPNENQSAIQNALTELHRTSGVLRMIALDGLVVYCGEIEKVLQDIAAKTLPATPANQALIQRSLLALTHYLDALMDGASNAAIRLFNPYQELQQARGVEMSFEADLFFPDLEVTLPSSVLKTPIQANAQARIKAERSQFQRALLQWLRGAGQNPAQTTEALQSMRQAVSGVMACEPQNEQRAFWWIATGVLDCLLIDGVPPELNAKSVLGRIDRQMKFLLDGGKGADEARTAIYEMLYLLARSHVVSELAENIKQVYALADYLPQEATLPPEEVNLLLEQMRAQHNVAQSTWEQCLQSDEPDLYKNFIDQASHLSESAERLDRNTLQYLCKQIYAAATKATDTGSVQRIAKPMAMTLLLLESGIENYSRLSRDFHDQARLLSEYLLESLQQSPVDTDKFEKIVALNMRLDDRKVMAPLVIEILDNLQNVEQGFSAFFNTPALRGDLVQLGRLLQQVLGITRILSLDQAEQITRALGQTAARYVGGGNPTQAEMLTVAVASGALVAYVKNLAQGQQPDSAPLEKALRELLNAQQTAPTATAPVAPTLAPADTEGWSDDDDLQEIFLEEATEVLETLRVNLDLSHLHRSSREPLIVMRRGFHTLKGSSRMVGLTEIGDVAWGVERAMNKWLESNKPANTALLKLISDARQIFQTWVEQLVNGQPVAVDYASLLVDAEEVGSRAEEAFIDEPALTASLTSPGKAAEVEKSAIEVMEFEMPGPSIPVTPEPVTPESVTPESVTPEPALTIMPEPEIVLMPETGQQKYTAPLPDLSATLAEPLPEIVSDLVAEQLMVQPPSRLPDEILELSLEFQPVQSPVAASPQAEQVVVAQPVPLDFDWMPKSVEKDAWPEQAPVLAAPPELNFDPAHEPAAIIETEADEIRIGGVSISPTLFKISTEEATQHVAALKKHVANLLASQPPTVEHGFMRAGHTLAGVAQAMGITQIADLAHALELWLQARIETEFMLSAGQEDMLKNAVATLETMVADICATRSPPAQLLLVAQLRSEKSKLGEKLGLEEKEESSFASKVFAMPEAASIAETMQVSEVEVPLTFEIPPASAEFAAAKVEVVTEEMQMPEYLPEDLPAPILSPPEMSLPEASLPEVYLPEVYLPEAALPEISLDFDTPAAPPPPAPPAWEALPTISLPIVSMPPASEPPPEGRVIKDDLDADLLPIFMEEGDDLYQQISNTVRRWNDQPGNEMYSQDLLRALHTLKGGARMAGAMRMGELVHLVEDYVGQSTPQSNENFWTGLENYLDRIGNVLEQLRAGVAVDENTLAVLPVHVPSAAPAVPLAIPRGGQHGTLLAAPVAPVVFDEPAEESQAVHEDTVQPEIIQPKPIWLETIQPESIQPESTQRETIQQQITPPEIEPSVEDEAPSPLARFMPAGLSQTDSPLARFIQAAMPHAAPAKPSVITPAMPAAMLRVRSDLVDHLVSDAGEISVARSRIEAELRAFKTGLSELTGSIERLRKQLREVEIHAEGQIQARESLAGDAAEKFDPLEFDRFTQFQDLTRSMSESVHDVQTVQQALLKNLDETSSALAAQTHLTREVQQKLMTIRMVPFSTVSERLYRIVRQTGRELGKKVNLEIEGSEIEIDRSVLEKMTAPFEHLLRNSIVHGLEVVEERERKGKLPVGEIRLTLRQENNEVVFSFADDGAGLDIERLRQKAVENGLLQADDTVNENQIMQFIFASGLSTVSEVTEVAGRGVGMDVVRSEIVALGGRIDVYSARHKGARFEIHLPLTLAVAQTLMVRAHNEIYAIHSGLVEQVQKVKASALTEMHLHGQLEWGGQIYPLSHLARLLGDENYQPETLPYNAILLLRSGDRRMAVHVDELMGNQDAVVKSMDAQLSRAPGVAGATVLGSGKVVLILNPLALISRVVSTATVRVDAAAPTQPAPEAAGPMLVMVVDDSLTVRKATTRMLVRAGYQVVTAKDGIDALEKLADCEPSVMLLDIEMPRMDGFELTKRLRSDPKYKTLPIVMITSRAAEKHRKFAMELGVNAYLGKPYQEEQLLEHVKLFSEDELHQHQDFHRPQGLLQQIATLAATPAEA